MPIGGIDGSVVFGCHFDDGNGVASSTDYSIAQAPKAITFVSPAACSNAALKFGPSVLALDGITAYLELAAHADFGKDVNGLYSAEAWIYPASVTAFYYIMGNGDKSAGAADAGWSLYMDTDSNLYFRIGGGGTTSINAAHGMTANTWNHVAWDVGADGIYRLYVNGVVIATSGANTAAMTAANPFRIGRVSVLFEFNGYFSGYVEEPRLSKGKQRWGGAFTPPTLAYAPWPSFVGTNKLRPRPFAPGLAR